MRTLAIIPARGGSKGLPRKNLLMLNGLPLIAWSILQARETPVVSKVIVSTDSEEIAEVARQFGAETPFLRPAELAQDDTPTEPVMLHALDWLEERGMSFDNIILLQPTSPLRFPHSISGAIEALEQNEADSVVGVCNNHYFFWKNFPAPEALYDHRNRPRRQDIREVDRLYRENGSIYVTRVAAFRETRNRIAGKIALYLMRDEEGIEIDSRLDFAIISSVMKEMLPNDH